MDEIDKRILLIVSNHPEGLSYRQIWNLLRDENGNHLIAFPTLLRRVDQLEKRGYLEIDRSEWKRGRKKIVKPKISPIVKDLLNLLRSIERSFKDLCSGTEDKYKTLAIRDLFLHILGYLKGHIIALRILEVISEELEKLLQSEIDSVIMNISIYHSQIYNWRSLIAQNFDKIRDIEDLVRIAVKEKIKHAKNTEKYLSDEKVISNIIRTLERNLSM